MSSDFRHEHRVRGSFGTGFGLTLGVFAAIGFVMLLGLLALCVLPAMGLGILGAGATDAARKRAERAAVEVAAAKQEAPPAPPPVSPSPLPVVRSARPSRPAPKVTPAPTPKPDYDTAPPVPDEPPAPKPSPGTPERPFADDPPKRTDPKPDAPPAIKPKTTRTLYPVAGKLPVAISEFSLTRYEGIAADPSQVAAMVADKKLLMLTEPTEVDVPKQWENEAVIRVILQTGPRKGELLYCRRAHLTPPAVSKK